MKKDNLIELKENAQHGDYILPFTIYEGTISDNYKLIPIHWHDEIELTIIRSGKAQYNIDLNNYIIKENSIVVLRPEMLHSISQIEGYTMTWSTMVFDIKMLNSASTDGCLLKYLAPLINNIHQLPLIIHKNDTGYEEILKVLNNIFNCYMQKDIAYELELKALLYHLFALFYKFNLVLKEDENNLITSNTILKIKKCLNYISDHYNENITIQDLAHLCEYSEYHFMRFFKKNVGMSAVQYINNFRLDKASILLTTTNKSIMEISFDVGFDNLSYFNKLFKRKFNITPKIFRLNK